VLVRHHLLLIDTATRRDLDDPETVRTVAEAVRDTSTLELLAALTEADASPPGRGLEHLAGLAARKTWSPGSAGALDTGALPDAATGAPPR